MEEPLSTVAPISTSDCANCGQPAMGGDHPTALCRDCRERFSRLHIPVWIWIFAGCVAVVLLFSLFTLPRSISLGVHLEKGKKAIKEKRFNTAEKELSKVLEKVPSNIEARGNLLIAAFYNQDLALFVDEYKKLDDVKAVNSASKALYGEIEKVMLKADGYGSNDDFEAFKKTYTDEEHIPDTAWGRYLRAHGDDRYATMEYATLLYGLKKYHLSDSIAELALQSDYEYFPALELKAVLKKEQGDLDGAMAYADRICVINQESVWGLSAKARTLLRQKKLKPGLDAAVALYDMDKDNIDAMSTLILAYHFNGRMGERDALIRKARSSAMDSTGRDDLQYAIDVINDKRKF